MVYVWLRDEEYKFMNQVIDYLWLLGLPYPIVNPDRKKALYQKDTKIKMQGC